MGWIKGFEPSTLGTTIRCSNQLSYIHHLKIQPVKYNITIPALQYLY